MTECYQGYKILKWLTKNEANGMKIIEKDKLEKKSFIKSNWTRLRINQNLIILFSMKT